MGKYGGLGRLGCEGSGQRVKSRWEGFRKTYVCVYRLISIHISMAKAMRCLAKGDTRNAARDETFTSMSANNSDFFQHLFERRIACSSRIEGTGRFLTETYRDWAERSS